MSAGGGVGPDEVGGGIYVEWNKQHGQRPLSREGRRRNLGVGAELVGKGGDEAEERRA